MKIAIIGSGITGLACVRRLADAGLTPTLFDKGRGIGGRVATRRVVGGIQFDHGAQFLSGDTAGFRSVLDEARIAGHVADWEMGDGSSGAVGLPGMTGFAKYLAQGLDLHQGTEITALVQEAEGWALQAERALGRFDRVICTAPAPQTTRLAGQALTRSLGSVTYDPSLTLMVALNRALDAPAAQSNPVLPFARVARDSAKPGRATQNCWVVQADADWSVAHLEHSREEIATLMLDLFLTCYGLDPTDVIHAAAHRWRYALVTRPLGIPFVTSRDQTLYAGGDWCLGPRVEHAWQSGTAIADDILRTA